MKKSYFNLIQTITDSPKELKPLMNLQNLQTTVVKNS